MIQVYDISILVCFLVLVHILSKCDVENKVKTAYPHHTHHVFACSDGRCWKCWQSPRDRRHCSVVRSRDLDELRQSTICVSVTVDFHCGEPLRLRISAQIELRLQRNFWCKALLT